MPQIACDKTVSVTWVSNYFDPVANRTTVPMVAGKTVGEALLHFIPLARPDFAITACLNGQVMETLQHSVILLPGDSLVMTATPFGGGGGDGKNPLAMVAMIAVMVVASIVSYGTSSLVMSGAWSWGMGTVAGASNAAMFAGGLAAAGVTALGGMLVSSAFKPKQPDFGGFGGLESSMGASPSYSWSAQANPLAEGTILPVLYGRFLVTPPLIGRYVESAGKTQHLNLLYALTGHEITEVESVLVNDQPHTVFQGTQLDVRQGRVDQQVVPYFNDLKEEISIGTKLTTEWAERDLPGSMQGFAVGLSYQLYYANDGGGMSTVTANIEMEYRRKNAENWIRYRRVTTTETTVTEYRWSAGYFKNPSEWIELEAGSTDKNDHADYEPYVTEEITAPEGTDARNYYFWRWVGEEIIQSPSAGGTDYIPISGAENNVLRHVVFCDNLPEGPYQVRVRLRSALSESARHGSTVNWEFAQTIQYDDFEYPGTAVVGLRCLATDQLSGGQPTIKVLARRDTVQVYDPALRRYMARSARNPAWACYDCLHNGAPGNPDRGVYGMGVPHTRIVYADFADWAAWCDERGYTIDLYIESAQSARDILDMLALMGRGVVVQIGSRFTCIVDRPRELPRQVFLAGMGNIVSKTLTKGWLEMQDRANVVELTYFDREASYQRQTVEIYQDGFDASDRTINRTSRTLYGCTDRKSALVFGRGLMLRNRYLTYMPSFEVGTEAIHCLPGDVIDLAEDILRGGASGRLLADAHDTVLLDQRVTLLPNVQYAIDVQHIDTDDRESVYVVGVAEKTETDTLFLVAPFAKVVPEGSNFAFGEVGRTRRMFTVVDMRTAPDQRKRLQLLEYVPELYDDEVVDIPEPPDPGLAFVRNLVLVEQWQPGGPDGSGTSKIGVSWRGEAFSWQVWFRETQPENMPPAPWVLAGTTANQHFDIAGVTIGTTYDVAVSIGSAQTGSVASITLRGKLAPPADVTGFQATVRGDSIRFDWHHVPDVDLWAYEIRQGTAWDSAIIILDGVTTNCAEWYPPMDGTYRFWIKAVDLSGIPSVNAADSLVTIDISGVLNVVWQSDELPDGIDEAELYYLMPADAGRKVVWLPGMTDTDVPEFTDQYPAMVDYLGDSAQGIYTTRVYDIGALVPFSFRMYAEFTSALYYVTDLTIAHRTDMTFPRDTDISVSSLATYTSQYRHSEDNENWSEWSPFTVSREITARYLQFRFFTSIHETGAAFYFTRLSGLADVPDQSAILHETIPAEGRTFTIAEAGLYPMLYKFHVGVTLLGATPLSPSVEYGAQEFFVRCFDRNGNAHSAQASLEIRGF